MGRAAKHRHVAEGGYARGEETRARIVTAALRMFGEQGFDGSSTRDIATSAGVNAPALQYYFDNKEGVYLACVQHIVKRVWESMSDVVDIAESKVAENADDAVLIEAYCAIQERLCRFMFTSVEADDWRLFLARLQAGEGPPAGFQFIYQHISGRMSRVLSTVVGRLLGRPPDDEETLVRTAMLSGQLHVFHVSRRSVLTKLNWDRIDERRLNLLVRVNREHTGTLLRAMVKSRGSAGAVHTLHGKRPASRLKKKAGAERH
jgi:TetR/AcrR family transcriptional regulator, regulator of cefoperazone and chloramphenicol sensitivity